MLAIASAVLFASAGAISVSQHQIEGHEVTTITHDAELPEVHIEFLVAHASEAERIPDLKVGSMIQSKVDMGHTVFNTSKILIIAHDHGKGSIGVMLNKAMSVPALNLDGRFGGPVSLFQIVYLHNDATLPGAQKIIDGVYMGGDVKSIEGKKGIKIQKFYGHAGWMDGQLDGEILRGDWDYSNDAKESMVFATKFMQKYKTPETSADENPAKETIAKKTEKHKKAKKVHSKKMNLAAKATKKADKMAKKAHKMAKKVHKKKASKEKTAPLFPQAKGPC